MKTLIRFFAAFVLISLTIQAMAQQPSLQYFRPYDQSGINMFETPKDDMTPFDGVKVRVGGNFAQQFQMLDHEHGAGTILDPNGDGVNENELFPLNSGFNLATANLNIDAQLGDGVRLSLITYLSSRHHSEAWVKGGYIQFDKLPFAPGLDDLMKNFTIRLGHMEINYGDAHFRRTDNGNALYNPFVGNLIMDAFNTEIGGEIYFQKNGAIAMVGVTGGEIKGNIKDAGDAKPNDDNANPAPTFLVKLGYDSDVSEDLRIRLTGSMYYTGSSASNSLYSGDRGGSRYYLVMENLAAAEGTNFRSGRWNPGFSDNVTAFMINPFVKFQGLELFGTYELAKVRKSGEAEDRTATQIAVEASYRIGEKENVFIGGRYNTVTSETAPGTEIQINRIAGSIGWFINPHILMKAEYVTQDYNDFPNTDILFEGNFSGLMLEAVVGF